MAVQLLAQGLLVSKWDPPLTLRQVDGNKRLPSITTALLQFSTLFTGNCFVAGKGAKWGIARGLRTTASS